MALVAGAVVVHIPCVIRALVTLRASQGGFGDLPALRPEQHTAGGKTTFAKKKKVKKKQNKK